MSRHKSKDPSHLDSLDYNLAAEDLVLPSDEDPVLPPNDLAGQLQRNEAIFRNLISQSCQLQQKEENPSAIDSLSTVQALFETVENNCLSVLSKVDSSLQFLNKKFRCLELIFGEMAKLRRAVKEAKAKSGRQEKQFILNLAQVESRYQQEL